MADEIMNTLSGITDQQIIDGLRCTRNPNAPDGADCEACPWISVHEYDGDEWTTCDVWRLQSAAADRLEALSKGLHGIMAQIKKSRKGGEPDGKTD